MTSYTISSGVVSTLNLHKGDSATVLNGGKTVSTTDAGLELVSSGGIADVTTVLNGGKLTLLAGSVSSNATVSAGGTLSGPGVLVGTTEDFGVVNGAVLGSGGGAFATLNVESGGVVSNLTQKRGLISVNSGGVALGTVVDYPNYLYVNPGGRATGTILDGGHEDVAGASSGTIINSSGSFERTYDTSATTWGTIVKSGGIEYVPYGVATSTTVSSGGVEYVSNGKALEAVVDGGYLYVYAGGSASGTTLKSGGHDVVYGKASGTVISSSSHEQVSSGGVTIGANVKSGGTEYVHSGGIASGVTVSSGGALIENGSAIFSGAVTARLFGVLSGSGTITETGTGSTGSLVIGGVGSAFVGVVVISGGTVELATAGGVGKSPVIFASSAASATLLIDAADTPAAGSTFASPLSNFKQTFDALDLRGVAFVSGATAVVTGSKLVVADGGKTYDFALSGTSGSTFQVTTDFHGGALIRPAATPKASVQAMAAVGASTDPSSDLVMNSSNGLAPEAIVPTPGTKPLLTETAYSDDTGTAGSDDLLFYDMRSLLTGTRESFSGPAFNAGKPDVLSVPTLDFASWSAMLGDATSSVPDGADTTFASTTTGDKFTLDGATVAKVHALTPGQAHADFTFHA
jgi:autotransporter passenger strand-loop-strand repeat protein